MRGDAVMQVVFIDGVRFPLSQETQPQNRPYFRRGDPVTIRGYRECFTVVDCSDNALVRLKSLHGAILKAGRKSVSIVREPPREG